jgi:hypothetical protein
LAENGEILRNSPKISQALFIGLHIIAYPQKQSFQAVILPIPLHHKKMDSLSSDENGYNIYNKEKRTQRRCDGVAFPVHEQLL